MKSSHSLLFATGLLVGACAQTELSQRTDLSIATYRPTPNALAIAERRGKQYWAKHRDEINRGTRYLAIENDTIPSANIPDLYYRLTHSLGVNGSDLEEYHSNPTRRYPHRIRTPPGY